MNFTESFQEFSSKLSTLNLALYAGAGLVLWVLFKDKLSPVQEVLSSLINKIKGEKSVVPNDTLTDTFVPTTPAIPATPLDSDDIFFKLVASWKQTRDLAELSECSEAVKVADQMFPFLSPNVCSKKQDKVV